MFRDYFLLSCKSPLALKGKNMIDFLYKKSLDKLICNLSMADKCPPKCYCFEQPELERTVVNCSWSDINRIPPALPEKPNLDVDLANNQISDLNPFLKLIGQRHLTGYQTLKKINLSNNTIESIPDKLFYSLRTVNLIDLRFNYILRIPRSLQIMRPCQVLLGPIVIKCTCDDLWLKNWLPGEGTECWNNVVVNCNSEDGSVNISDITQEMLGCIQHQDNFSWVNHVFVTACLFTVIVSLITFKFRFEIFILSRKIVKHLKRRSLYRFIYPYDVYISCNEENE